MTTAKTNSISGEESSEASDEEVKSEIEMSKKSSTSLCKLDEKGRLNLHNILSSFNGPVGEEQAWALCYQAAKTLSSLPQNKCYKLSKLSQIFLHKDGNVVIDTKCSIVSERKAVYYLGTIIFKALDFGSKKEEERTLPPALEKLITLMTNSEQDSRTDCETNTERLQETDDEGIERDSGEMDIDEFAMEETNSSYEGNSSTFSLKHVLNLCTIHMETTTEVAEMHYRAVIRAYVAEALELSQFLRKVATNKLHDREKPSSTTDNAKHGSTSLHELDRFGFNDWTDIRIWRAIQARFWVQVISELRKGVKLKKVEANLQSRGQGQRRGAEFELTPYEILMDDIRERRYRLKKTPSPTPHSKKDVHAIILEFIRSRPPLKKASERQLPPLRKECTLRELLMESIKKPPKPLRSSRERRQTPTIEERIRSNGGESRRIVLGEVPPIQPEQEQEPAQDVAAQWLQSDDQTTTTTTSTTKTSRVTSGLAPVPQPRQRIGKFENRVPGNRNQQTSDINNMKENGSPTVPKPARRDSDSLNTRRTRKIIPVDFDLKLDAEDEDDEDYNDELNVTRFEEEDETYDYPFENRDIPNDNKDHDHERDDEDVDSANPWKKTGGLRLTKNEYHRFCDTQLESYDLATQCPSRRASARKHAARRNIGLISFTGTTSLPHSRPQSRQHANITGSTLSQGTSPNISLNPSPSLSPQPRARQPRRSNTVVEGKDSTEDRNVDWQEDNTQKSSLGDMFFDERLSLTLEEIVHIRSVLTKAELESLPVEGQVKEDVEKRRVCFLCLKTRFGLLGPWGQRCRLCERTVCVKCYSKMRIPTEHFAHVPVVLLSPGLLLSPSSSEPDTSGKNSWLRGTGAVGSAPASPASRRKDSALRSITPSSTPATTPLSAITPTSIPLSNSRRDIDTAEKRNYKGSGSPATTTSTKAFSTFASPNSEQRLAAERLRGSAMVVCHDCRIMVIQIIKSSRTTRATIRNNVISRLTLSLSPAYV
ncbi:protein spire isoform X2 [Polistes fuscatus]|uniref:protein spire isoform X2 n=1 Tax=Polistes fuscatus TaxID=30207 RepID=UPI001CA85D80|nr:protein spire isoform X2 [Polistes fuscatus]